ncbi:hypothetical protein DVH05_019661 [Phytophthora capsici]|nr:hypothetical protein DVH05_019661 [Phytophthora capsici]
MFVPVMVSSMLQAAVLLSEEVLQYPRETKDNPAVKKEPGREVVFLSVTESTEDFQRRLMSLQVENCHASAQPLNGSESIGIVCVGGKQACPGSLTVMDSKGPPGIPIEIVKEGIDLSCTGVGKNPILTRTTGSEFEPLENPVT